MGMTYTTLPTGIRLPQCSHCSHEIFCRDAEVEHRVQVEKTGGLSMNTPQLPLEVIGPGVRHCNITCACCVQGIHREAKA